MGTTPSHPHSSAADLPPPNDTIGSIGLSYTVVWCDATIGSTENSLDDSNTIIRLTRIVNKKRRLIHTFKEMAACRDFLNQVNHVCLIVSGSMGEQLVPQIHNLEQVHSIYVFCLNRAIHEAWAKHYSKVRGVFTNIEKICNDLKLYFMPRLSMEYDQLQFEIFARPVTLPIRNPPELSFVYSLASRILLLSSTTTKDEMIQYCRRDFTNDYQMRSIRDLERNFAQHDEIWWFTKDKFFQEIINQALATHDLYTLYAMNFLISNLERRLEALQPRRNANQEPLTLYFSQTMTPDSLQRLRSSQGGLMCIHEFLFANPELAIASVLIEGPASAPVDPQETNVMFRLQIPPNIEPNVPYANIGAACRFVHQREYLFGMASVFRINQIEPIKDVPSAWFVHLTLVDRNDPQLVAIHNVINEDFLDEDYDLADASAAIKTKLSQFKVTRKFFEPILNFNLQQIRTVLRHYHLGMIHNAFGNFDRAIEEYRAGIRLIAESRSDHQNDAHICLIPFYSSVGVAIQENRNSVDSFLQAYRALNILGQNRSHPLYTPWLAAAVHINLGWISEQQENYKGAQTHYNEALKSKRSYLPEDHPERLHLQHLLQTLEARISRGSS